MKRLHTEDKNVAHNFIDYARLKKSKPTRITLEIAARRVAEHIGINPDQSNARLANALAGAFETGKVA